MVATGSPTQRLNARQRSNDSSTGGWYSALPHGVVTSPPSGGLSGSSPPKIMSAGTGRLAGGGATQQWPATGPIAATWPASSAPARNAIEAPFENPAR